MITRSRDTLTSTGVKEHGALYHVTRGPIDEVLAQGLDQRVSRIGMFGRGIYFTDDPLKANMYSKAPPGQLRFMLRANVLLGKTKVGLVSVSPCDIMISQLSPSLGPRESGWFLLSHPSR